MIQDINLLLSIIESSITWAKDFGKDSFPIEELKEYRRTLKPIANSLSENCSAAAFGESQVGKSYLISSLLSTPESPFVITNNGKNYSFIDKINPSGGNTSKTESTGVVTRFTIDNDNELMKDYIKIKNLSVADLLMLLVDSYYNDLKIDSTKVLLKDSINEELTKAKSLWTTNTIVQNVLSEDDVKNVCDYISQILGSNAVNITRSDFKIVVAPKIKYVSCDDWVKIFCILWNKNEELSNLFSMLIKEYKKINFNTEVYVPFEAVLRDKGTLLKIEWLDSVCDLPHETKTDDPFTEVYNPQGKLIASKFKKSSLSALIAELRFIIPIHIANDRHFLKKIDLLDFPGVRSREKFNEQEISAVLPTILRRGKVAYLFNKYSRDLNISSVLFCHHNDQKNEPTLGETINDWIESEIGKTPETRTEGLTRTKGISPLFFIATKFNIELERTKNDSKSNTKLLSEHWKRFKTVIPEIIKPATWFDNWVKENDLFRSKAFQSIYLLRDYYWSMKNQVFDGYDEKANSPEFSHHIDEDYPEYFDNLKQNFLNNEFVKNHFSNPQASWDEVTSINSDGSRAIIRDLNAISEVLDTARRDRYLINLRRIKNEIIAKLKPYYEPEDIEEINKKTRDIVGKIRITLDLQIGSKPEIFGYIIDQLMIPSSDLRKIAYDIVILKTETPKDFNAISLIRTRCGINTSDDKQINLMKLFDYYPFEIETLDKMFQEQGFTIEDIISNECRVATTVADVISNNILDYWTSFINQQVKNFDKYLPYSDQVALMLQILCKRLGVQKKISEKIDQYTRFFSNDNLPNAIADFASLTLNNFVSSIGRSYMTNEDIDNVRIKAQACDLKIDLSPEASDIKHTQISIHEALDAFDSVTDPTIVPFETLKKLPFWDNFQRWENLLIIGLLMSADISNCDPIANKKIKEIISNCENIFKN